MAHPLQYTSWLQANVADIVNLSIEYRIDIRPQLPFSLQVLTARNPVYSILDKPNELFFPTHYSLYATFTRQQVTEHRLGIKRRVGRLNSLGKLGRVGGGKDDLNGCAGAMTDITESTV